MTSPQQKTCPRCSQTFSCQAKDIEGCQCSEINLTSEERRFIAGRYSDCLCQPCLFEIKKLTTSGKMHPPSN